MSSRFARRDFLGAAALGTTVAAVAARPARAGVAQPAGGGASVVGGEIWLNIRASAAARVSARLWPTGHPERMIVTKWYQTNRSHAARIPVPQALATDGPWSWQGLVQDPLGLTPPIADSVRTILDWPARGVAAAFTFAFGSCIIPGGAAPVLSHAAAAHPKFFAMIGDMSYADVGGTQDYARWSTAFQTFMRNPDAAQLIKAAPIMAMQDDHDYGLDECWANTWKLYTAEAYADVVPGTQYPNTSYRRFGLGDVDVWLLDCRRYKDPNGGPYENGQWMSVIRKAQRDWLLYGLATSTALIKVILAPMTFGYYWQYRERTLVTQWIKDWVRGTVIFCTGDRHQTAFVRPAANVWELLACPINNPTKTVAHWIPNLIWVEHPGQTATSNAVGVVEIDTQTAKPYLTLRAVTDNGATLHAETVYV
jgi:hypothetical protein